MRRFALAAALNSTTQVLALVFGLLAMVWGLYLGTHGGADVCPFWLEPPLGIPRQSVPMFILLNPGPPCGFSPPASQDVAGFLLFIAGLAVTVVVVGRNLPRRLSERPSHKLPQAWR